MQFTNCFVWLILWVNLLKWLFGISAFLLACVADLPFFPCSIWDHSLKVCFLLWCNIWKINENDTIFFCHFRPTDLPSAYSSDWSTKHPSSFLLFFSPNGETFYHCLIKLRPDQKPQNQKVPQECPRSLWWQQIAIKREKNNLAWGQMPFWLQWSFPVLFPGQKPSHLQVPHLMDCSGGWKG